MHGGRDRGGAGKRGGILPSQKSLDSWCRIQDVAKKTSNRREGGGTDGSLSHSSFHTKEKKQGLGPGLSSNWGSFVTWKKKRKKLADGGVKIVLLTDSTTKKGS